jgi:hypothetical protein
MVEIMIDFGKGSLGQVNMVYRVNISISFTGAADVLILFNYQMLII